MPHTTRFAPRWRAYVAAFFAAGFLGAAGAATRADELSFNRDIRPILSDKCFVCHGFDAKNRKADLRLDVADSATTERNGVTAIKPRDLAGSDVWSRINSDDPDVIMPPPKTNKKLTAAEKETIRRWIEQGAPYQKHWAFEPPVAAAEPQPQRGDWGRTPIDRFLLARLEREKLTPQPEADRTTLIRRVAFALTGLPPTMAEVDAYLTDNSPTAYEAMVDRYLKSPHYGEEMARHWLDVARYADTHGLHLDNERQMWAYRDWVVKAFNENLPFDQFTVWQLAGDQLPNPTKDQLVATGFNRCNVTTSEGGSIAEEFLYRYAVDRTATVIQTWMGMTGGCAVCHDHKYDPLSMREFYSLYAFFYSAADPAMDGNINVTSPFIKLPKPGQQEALDAAIAREREVLQQLETAAEKVEYQDPADMNPAPAKARVNQVIFDDLFPLGSTTRNTSRNSADWDDRPSFDTPSGRRVLRQANSAFHENIVQSQLIPVVIPEDGKFKAWLRTDTFAPPAAVAVVVTTPKGTRRLVWGRAEAFENINSSEVHVVGPLPRPGVWSSIVCSAADAGLTAGQPVTSLSLQEAGGLVWWDAPAWQGELAPAEDPLVSFAAWRKALAGKSPPDLPEELRGIVKDGPGKEADPALVAKLRRFYLTRIAQPVDPTLVEQRRAWDEARAARAAADDAIEGTFIFKDVEKPRDSFVMLRGQYDKPGDKVEPNVPAVMPALKKQNPEGRATRLDLARWLVSPEHPLAARVTVNRLWQQLFGVGLVKTSADFGSQGEMPSHPELLDWLAIRFRDSGWNTKELVRLMVTSAAFRQAARVTPDVLTRDPENRLYARGPRFRLDAEQIRDNALFVSGLIQLEMGGRGAKSYQPPNIWEPVGYSDSNTRHYLQDHGEALYRRSLYCFLKRTAPPPFMSNFDGPNREQACSRRERSNTPLQALQLMNDVQHFEAARALAERIITKGGATTDERITFLYRTVLARAPSPDERRIVNDAFSKQQQLFSAEPAAAEKAVRVGESQPKLVAPAPELAAWTLLANLVLNLDETVMRN